MTRKLLVAALALVMVAGCSSDGQDNGMGLPTRVLLGKLTGASARPVATANPEDPAVKAGILAYRAQLEADGQPILLASNQTLKYGTLHAPFGQNGDVQTWSSTGYQEISLRGGVLIATRGFGPDLISAVAPGVATIARGTGTTNRTYHYLDGADQPQRIDFSCTLALQGAQTIEVMAKRHATRKVTESCSGPSGSFVNEYWFDNGLNIRQSSQRMAPGLDNLFMQRVVD
jgi:Group 4 capsule polysaccharide lipoprotein gfcB, YjbF